MSAAVYSERDRVRMALSVIPAEDYTTWVEMAFAVKSGLGEAGFEVWDEWSRGAFNYDAPAALRTWRSVKEDGTKRLGSLFWLAGQYGFDPARYPSHEFTSGARERVPVAAEQVLRRLAKARAKAQVRHVATAAEARELWRHARTVQRDHPYLLRKAVGPVDTLRELNALEVRRLAGYTPKSAGRYLTGRVLLVPVHIDDVLSTLEFIDELGRKSAMAGGAKSGGYWSVGALPRPVDQLSPTLIAEGMATALSAHRATGWFAIAALSSGNLPKVAQSWRSRYPDIELVVLADRGAGQEYAQRAACEAGARLAIPMFAASARLEGDMPTDFNDLARLAGLDTVRTTLEVARRGESGGMSVNEPTRGHRSPHRTDPGDANIDGAEPVDMRFDEFDATHGVASMVSDVMEELDMAKVKATARAEAKNVARPDERSESAGVHPTGDEPSAAAPVQSGARRQVRAVLYELADVPPEVKAIAQHRFGADIRMATPRENGGPYKGEVFDTERYLIQEVSPRSVVFHAKDKVEFVAERLKWSHDHQRLNGTDIQIGYDGEAGKAYPWDRARDLLNRTVASLKKSAGELGLGEDVSHTLDQLQEKSWSRVKEARSVALAQAKDRSASERSAPSDASSDGPNR